MSMLTGMFEVCAIPSAVDVAEADFAIATILVVLQSCPVLTLYGCCIILQRAASEFSRGDRLCTMTKSIEPLVAPGDCVLSFPLELSSLCRTSFPRIFT